MEQDPKAIRKILEKCRHILVIRLRYVGDAIWIMPFLENLKRNLPDATVSILTNAGTEVFFHNVSFVDHVIPFPRNESNGGLKGLMRLATFIRDLRRHRPDAVIDLTDSDRSSIISFFSGARERINYTPYNRLRNRLFTRIVRPLVVQHMVGYHLDFLREIGLAVFDEAIHLPHSQDSLASIMQKFPSLSNDDGRKRVVIHPGARISLRQWGEDRFARLADLLSERCRIFLVAGPDEEKVLNDVAQKMETIPEICTTNLSLTEFAELCGMADIFIGNDSGPIHVAAPRTYVIGIYGPNTGYWAGPWSPDSFVFEDSSLECRPCTQSDCTAVLYKECLARISPDAVAEKVLQILARR